MQYERERERERERSSSSRLVLALLIAVPLTAFGGWERLRDIRNSPCDDGSAMCYGMHNGTPYVWLLHGLDNTAYAGDFDRYNITTDQPWVDMQDLNLGGNMGEGGAIAYVPDPYADPSSGWIFYLHGDNLTGFSVYYPAENEWYPAEPMLENVKAGGCLCYGGVHALDGIPHAFLYAFSGYEDDGQAKFYRYTFKLVPYDGPKTGTWGRLANNPWPYGSGAGIAWVQVPEPQGSRTYVVAQRGERNFATDKYDVGLNQWAWQANSDYHVNRGGCMSVGPGSVEVSCFRGGGYNSVEWWTYDVPTRTYTYYLDEHATPLDQYGGSSICYDGVYLYAEFGYSATREVGNQHFYRYTFSGSGGSQGSVNRGSDELTVRTVRRGRQHVFRVADALPGNVTLTVHDATGRVRFRTQATTTGSSAELIWDAAGAGSGVYLYTVENGRKSAAGRLPLVK